MKLPSLFLSVITWVGLPFLVQAQVVLYRDLTLPLPGLYQSSVAFGDLDGDQDVDVILSGRETGSTGKIYVYLNQGQRNLVPLNNHGLPGAYSGSISLSDVDADGDIDVFLTGIASGSPLVRIGDLFLNDGTAHFSVANSGYFPSLSASAAVFEDIDLDQDPDLVLLGQSGGSFSSAYIFLNQGNGTFINDTTQTIPNLSYAALAAGDLDADGDPDLIVTGFMNEIWGNNYFTGILLNDGTGQFEEVENHALPAVAEGALALADLDLDLDLDLVLCGKADVSGKPKGITQVFANDGSGNFVRMDSSSLVGVFMAALDLGDLDGDGDADLVLSGLSQESPWQTELYINDGQGNFDQLNQSYLSPINRGALGLADLDGDQLLDLLISGQSYGDLYLSELYWNQTASTGIPDEFSVWGNLFPNPAYGSLRIQLNRPCPGCQIRIINLMGQAFGAAWSKSAGQELEVSLPAGVYVLMLTTETEVLATQRILIY